MKKILLALIAISLPTMLRAQDIAANGVPIGNNTVMYATSDIKIFNGKEKNSGVYSEVGLSLACEYNTKTKIKKWIVSLSLITDGKLTIKEGMQMLLKGVNGSVMTLKNNTEHYPKYWASRDMYFTAANYPATAQQFNLLKSKDFCKIRIVTQIKKLDYNLKGDEVKSALSKCYNVIQKEISNKTAGVYEGF